MILERLYCYYNLACLYSLKKDIPNACKNLEKAIAKGYKNWKGIDDGILDNLDKIKVYPIRIDSEEILVKQIARIANQAMPLGYKLGDENRLLTKEPISR